MITDPQTLMNYSKEELIRYIILANLPKKYKELFNTIQAGEYNTRTKLMKIYSTGTVDRFIRHGISNKYLKREWVHKVRKDGNESPQVIGIISPADPIKEFLNEQKEELNDFLIKGQFKIKAEP